MAVQVSLEKLIYPVSCMELWPERFLALSLKLTDNPDDPTPWGVIADYLDEIDEPGMARAYRWVMDREQVSVQKLDQDPDRLSKCSPYWWFRVTNDKPLYSILDAIREKYTWKPPASIPALMVWTANFLRTLDQITKKPEGSSG